MVSFVAADDGHEHVMASGKHGDEHEQVYIEVVNSFVSSV